MSARKFILVEFQGAAYNEYDPKIETLELQSSADQEIYFCSGNVLKMASSKIISVGCFTV